MKEFVASAAVESQILPGGRRSEARIGGTQAGRDEGEGEASAAASDSYASFDAAADAAADDSASAGGNPRL